MRALTINSLKDLEKITEGEFAKTDSVEFALKDGRYVNENANKAVHTILEERKRGLFNTGTFTPNSKNLDLALIWAMAAIGSGGLFPLFVLGARFYFSHASYLKFEKLRERILKAYEEEPECYRGNPPMI